MYLWGQNDSFFFASIGISCQINLHNILILIKDGRIYVTKTSNIFLSRNLWNALFILYISVLTVSSAEPVCGSTYWRGGRVRVTTSNGWRHRKIQIWTKKGLTGFHYLVWIYSKISYLKEVWIWLLRSGILILSRIA